MGKGPKRQRRAAKSSAKLHSRNDDAFRDNDMDDEIDSFHKQRERIPLDVNDDEGHSENEDIEVPVFGLEGDDNDESHESRSDDDRNDSDGMEDDVQYKGFAAKIARQAKILQQKFGAIDDEMDDHVEQEEEQQGKTIWGRGKNLYYDADNVEDELDSSDEDLQKEEEAEVLKIQREKAKYLSMEDFGLEDANLYESVSNEENKVILDAWPGKKVSRNHAVDDVLEDAQYEEIKKNYAGLTKEEQMDTVYSSAPELFGLLSELNEALDQIQIMKSVQCKVREKSNGKKERLHYLEVKHVLLLIYCQAISFYLLLKSEGTPVQDHPVVARLVELKNLLQKMNQLKVNLPLEDVIVNGAQINVTTDIKGRKNDKLEVELEKSPKVALNLGKDDSSKDSKKRSTNQKSQDSQVGLQSLEMLKVRQTLEAKLKEKGIYNFTKSKPEAVNRHLVSLNFDDEAGQTAFGHSKQDGITSILQSRKLSHLVGTQKNKSKSVSGDDDLPKRDDIGERRRRHELRVLARAGAVDGDGEMNDEDGEMNDEDGLESKYTDIDVLEHGEELESEDELYKVAKRQSAEKLSAKAERYSRTPAIPLSMETEVDGKRQITYQMEKNRGLTRPRKKIAKNPRKKYKLKYQKGIKRRKGQVRDIKRPTGSYGGESTGINTAISRSIRFKS